jgi:hypothetical protein
LVRLERSAVRSGRVVGEAGWYRGGGETREERWRDTYGKEERVSVGIAGKMREGGWHTTAAHERVETCYRGARGAGGESPV